MKLTSTVSCLVSVVLLLAAIARAAAPAPASSPPRLPIKEVTLFKDGHAFVVHEGSMRTDASGRVVLDHLPAPILGSFWAYSADKQVRLTSVIAGKQRKEIQRTALTLVELLEANAGAEVFIAETNGLRYPATILGFPTRGAAELAAANPPNAPEALPQRAGLVLLQTAEGAKALPADRIQDVTFKAPHRPMAIIEELRPRLTLNLDWGGRAPAQDAAVGLVYVQRGLRWIPSYRVDLDGKGQARIKLQAALVNELADLEDATVQLVIGVPSFYFKDSLDPMAPREAAGLLSSFFQSSSAPGRGGRSSALATHFSNSIMTQTAGIGDNLEGGDPGPALGPDLPEGAKNEDLFVFTVKNVSLKRGDRMALPLAEYTAPYDDIFALDVPYAPPSIMEGQFSSRQQAEIARLFRAPKVTHKARLTNKSAFPFTTAPALVLREGRVISQGLMTYAPPGAIADIALTTAVDIQASKTDSETKRAPNAFQHDGENYMRVDLKGSVRLVNRRGHPVKIEVKRHVLGRIDTAGQNGKIGMSNAFESREHLPFGSEEDASVWNSFTWPWWWHQVNGLGVITWTPALESGQALDLNYTWHYYRR